MAWRTISINNQGGSGTSPNPIYQNTVGPFYASAQSTAAQYRLFNGSSGQALSTLPTKSGNKLQGFYTSQNGGGTRYIDSTGYLSGVPILSSDITIYAYWTPYYKVTLAKGEYGSGGTSALYYKIAGGGLYSDSALTTLAETVIAPTGGGNFKGYYYNGVEMIDASGNVLAAAQAITISNNVSFDAAWFGGAVDYFGLASSALVPFESDDGTTRPRVVTRHYGKGQGGDETGPVWMNPTTKYMVVANTTFATSLGKAFAAVYSGGTMTKTGYMISSVTIETRIGQFPVVTVSAVANEGADAINTFAISIPILGRARPQNLLNAFSGGGELQAYTLAAMCEPVVMQLALAPCASDAVNGRLEAHGETLAVYGESVPACTSAGGFTEVGTPSARSGVGWTRYSISGVKEVF